MTFSFRLCLFLILLSAVKTGYHQHYAEGVGSPFTNHVHSGRTESMHDHNGSVGSYAHQAEQNYGIGAYRGMNNGASLNNISGWGHEHGGYSHGHNHASYNDGFHGGSGWGHEHDGYGYGAGSAWGHEHGGAAYGNMYGSSMSGAASGSGNVDAFGQKGLIGTSWGAEGSGMAGQAGSYGAAGQYGSRSAMNGYGDKAYIQHVGYNGINQNHLVGFHGIDYDLFGNGSLNHSYSKNLDRSYYGKRNEGLSISKLMNQWGFGNDYHAVGGSRCRLKCGNSQECSMSGLLGPYGTGSTSSGGVGLNGGSYLSSLGLNDGRSVQSASIVAAMMHNGSGNGIGGYDGVGGGYGGNGYGGHGLHGGQGVHGGHGGHGGHEGHGGLAVGSLSANGGSVVVESLSNHGFGGVIAGISASGARGRTFKFCEKSIEASLSDYNRFFTASRLFTFNPTHTSTYKIVLVSTTKHYHPQMKILEINKGGNEKYIEQFGQDRDNGIYSSRYALRVDREYLLEVGASEKLNYTPFMNVNTGGFFCIISSEKRSLQEILAQHEYKVTMWGKTAEVPLAHTEVLELSGDGKKEGCGRLDYSITPYYNEHQESITIYFHNPTSFSNGISGTDREAAKVEFECHHTGNLHQTFQGVEVAKRIVEFIVHCKTVCDAIDMLI